MALEKERDCCSEPLSVRATFETENMCKYEVHLHRSQLLREKDGPAAFLSRAV
jgi:hypothetical protein